MSASPHISGERGATTVDGLTPTTSAKLTTRAIRLGWTQQERYDVVREFVDIALDDSRAVRDRAAAARVLATLERNEIMAERNEIHEHGNDIAASTDRLRLLIQANPAARAAMASLTAPSAQETTQPAPPQEEMRVERGEGWASAGGLD